MRITNLYPYQGLMVDMSDGRIDRLEAEMRALISNDLEINSLKASTIDAQLAEIREIKSSSLTSGRFIKSGSSGLIESSSYAGNVTFSYSDNAEIPRNFGNPNTMFIMPFSEDGVKLTYSENSLVRVSSSSLALKKGYHRISMTTKFLVISDTPVVSRQFTIVAGLLLPKTTTNWPYNFNVWYGFDSVTAETDATSPVDGGETRRSRFVSHTFDFLVSIADESLDSNGEAIADIAILFGSRHNSFNSATSTVRFDHDNVGHRVWKVTDPEGQGLHTSKLHPTIIQIDSWSGSPIKSSKYTLVSNVPNQS